MSWTLFNHNLPTEAGFIVETGVVWGDPTVTHADSGTQKTNSYFACDRNVSKLMIATKGYGTVVFTDDAGETFSADRNLPGDDVDNRSIDYLRYDPVNDDFWANVVDYDSSRLAHYNYTEDDGVNWGTVAFSSGYDSHCFHIGDDGSLYISFNVSGSVSEIRKYTTPKSSTTHISRSIATGNKTFWTILPVNGKLLVTYGNAPSDNGGYVYVTDSSLSADALNPYGTMWNGRKAATSEIDALYVSNTGTDNTITLQNPAGDLPFEDDVVVNFGTECTLRNLSYGNGLFLVSAIRVSDPSQLLVMVAPQGDYGVWSGPYIVQMKHIMNYDSNPFALQVESWGGTEWLVGYRTNRPAPNDSEQYLVIERFTLPTPATLAKLIREITRQSPDIFCRFDDPASSESILDFGSKGYSNQAIGSLEFEQDGLVADNGTACLIDSDSDTAVEFSAVDAPIDYAHVFVLSHDGTAAVRTLISSSGGDFNDSNNIGYTIFLNTDHTIGVASYDSGWEYNYSTAVLAADTTYLCAVRVDGTTVTFYVADNYDSKHTSVPVVGIVGGSLALGGFYLDGAWAGCADGVTIDYYALIPSENFDYKLLVGANGGTYTPPGSEQGSAEGVEILIKSDAGPLGIINYHGYPVYAYANSAPETQGGTIIRNIHEGAIISTVSKFGLGAIYTPALNDYDNPPLCPAIIYDGPYGGYGGAPLAIGIQDFTFDCWAASLHSSGVFWPVCSMANTIDRSGFTSTRYGGFEVKVGQASSSTANIVVTVGTGNLPGIPRSPFASPSTYPPIILYYDNVPSYSPGNYNHIAVCRQNGRWYVALNGNIAAVSYVSRESGANEDTVYIHPSTYWLFGATRTNKLSNIGLGSKEAIYANPVLMDEIRLVVGRAEYVEPFTPPALAYDYS